MDVQEVMDVTVEVLDYAPALGVQVKTLAGFVVGPAVTWAAWKLVKWPFRKHAEAKAARRQALVELKESLVKVFEEGQGGPAYSPACEVILRSLEDPNPIYNPDKHLLLCPGVVVEFVDNYGKGIVRILGNPRFEGDKMVGTEVYLLLCPEEQKAVWQKSQEVRAAVVARDLKQANERAAAEITGAHYREKARQQAALLNASQPVHPPVYAAMQSSMTWLNEPASAVPQNSAKR